MNDSTTIGQITAALTLELSRARVLAAAESRIGGVAALGLISAVQEALDGLAQIRLEQLRDDLALTLPRIAGGSPDDHEEISSDFLRDPMSWPDDSDPICLNPPHVHDYADASSWDAWTDMDRWEETPLEVLARDHFDMERSDADWDDFHALCVPEGVTEADHIAAHGCC